MNALERQARYLLAIGLVTAVAFAILSGVGYGMTGHFSKASFGALGIYGFAGFTAFIGWRERRSGKTVMDERDLRIDREATVAGYSIFWVLFVAAAMTPMFVYGPSASVTLPTDIFGLAAFIGMIVVWTARSAVIVFLYRKDHHA